MAGADGTDMEYRSGGKVHDLKRERLIAKKKKRRRRFIGLMVLLIICVAGYELRGYWITPLTEFFSSRDPVISESAQRSGGGFPIQLSQSEKIRLTHIDDYPVVISDTRLTCYNKKGEQTGSYQHQFADPVADAMKKRLFVYDLNGSNFSVYDKNGEVYSKKTDDPIVLAEAGEDSKVAVVTQTDKYSSYLTIYDESGKEVFVWSPGQRIVSVSFNEKEDGCIVSAFSAKGGRLVSKIYGLEFNKDQEVFETEDLDCLIYKADYCENGDMWLVGDDILYRVSSDGSVKYAYSYERDLADFSLSGDIAVLVSDRITGGGSEIRIFSEKDTPAVFETENKVEKIKADGDQAEYLTDGSFGALNSSGKPVGSADISKDYIDFVLIDDLVYFMGYDQVDKVSLEK